MIRAAIYTLLSILAITFIRMAVGIVMKAMGTALKEESPAAAGSASKDVPKSGTLKKCAVCGTYSPAASAPRLTSVPASIFVCSEKCASAYKA